MQVLPAIVCFIDGISVDRILGFEELGGQDEFPTLILTRRLINSGCLKALNKAEKGEMKIKKKGHKEDISDGEENSSDNEW